MDISPYDSDTVDVGEVARNLHNREMYDDLWKILCHYEGASLSTSTVNILKTELNNNSKGVLNDKFENIRVRAVELLGLSRNPEAIDTVANRMFNDPAWRVRASAACGLGKLAGEKALPALLDALKKNKISNLNGGFGFAGDKAVPLIIRWMEKDFAKNGGQNHAQTHASRLRWIGDRRAMNRFSVS